MTDTPKYRVEREVYQSKMHLPEEADVVTYHAVSGLAIAGLVLGLLAPLALVSQAAWVLAIAGVLVNVAALRRIAAGAPALVGRKAALVGLTLSAIFFAYVPAGWVSYRRLVREEARQSAAIWFDYLRTGQPHKAYELTLNPVSRDRLDDTLWELFPEETEERIALERFVRTPVIRTLVALRDRATVRFYDTESQWADGEADHVYQTYAVTFPESDGLKTFFIGLVLDRSANARTRHAYWQIGRFIGGVQPKWLGGSGEPPRATSLATAWPTA
jgi:hypothetical protein